MKEDRPKIPDALKRLVRQNCGFGCVVCGQPLYEYDHMIEYSVVKEHKEENLTLLCDKHHREKTNGLLSLEQVVAANKNPYNIVNKESSPYKLNFDGSNFSVIIGNVVMSLNNANPKQDFIIPFLINNKKLISFHIIENQLFFDLVLLNRDNDLLLKIVQNEMIYSSEQWDIEFVGRRLKIREGRGNIIFDIEFIIPNSVQIHKAELNCDKYQINIANGGFTSTGFQMIGGGAMNFRVVCAIGDYDGRFPTMYRG